ncbi:MAG: Alkaline phosphatase [Gemmataceae bacterium]|nr:Alkaline phosphatase [Gemmataceae bacterium]
MPPTTIRVLALLSLVMTAAAATADPKKPVKFKPFGGISEERFYQSAVARRADQLVVDLTTARAELTSLRVPPPVRDEIAARVDRAAAAATSLATLARKTADRGQLYRALETVETEFAGLNELTTRNASASPAFARVGYDVQQLAAALTEGDTDADRGKESVARLAGALDEQADDLWTTADHQLGAAFTRDADRAIRKFARAARQLRRNLEATGDLAKAAAAFPAVGQAWGEVVAQLDRVPNLPAGVRDQVTRVDGLYRRLGERVAVLATPAPNPGVPPPPVIGLAPSKAAAVAIGAGDGGGPRVRVFHDLRAPAAFDFFAYDAEFRGGVRVAVADLNGDGYPDVVTVPGKGMPALVRVFDGRDMSLLAEFLGADPQWAGGVNVAAADVTADGRALVAVAPDVGGGPHVRVFDLAQGKEVASFFAFPEQLRGGVRVAWTDLNADGNPDIVAASGPADIGPLVRVFNLADQKVLTEFGAFDPNWRGGLWVSADRGGHIVCGLDGGGPPAVRVFNPGQFRRPAVDRLAFPEDYPGGVRVAYADVDGDGVPDIICAPGGGLKDCPVRVFSGKNGREIAGLRAFEGFDGGAFVGAR